MENIREIAIEIGTINNSYFVHGDIELIEKYLVEAQKEDRLEKARLELKHNIGKDLKKYRNWKGIA